MSKKLISKALQILKKITIQIPEKEASKSDKAELTAGLVIDDEDKAERAADLVFANLEKEEYADELTYQNEENVKLAAEIVNANIKRAKRSAELVIATVEKAKRAAELVIANKKLDFQKGEKYRRSTELIISNIEYAQPSAEIVNTSRELELTKEKEKLVVELTILNKELIFHINERKLAEEALLNSNIFKESLLKTIPFAMHIVDETGTVLFQSDSFKEVFGESAIGKKCWEQCREDKKQSSDCPLIKGITIGKTEACEAQGVHGNRIFEISHTGMMYQGKKALLEVFQDITERKKKVELISAKEYAVESERLKSAFLANMSHEIRTPLNGILGFTELLKEQNLSSDDRQDFIQTIQISSARLLNTINNIVDISKIESGLSNVDLKETNINEKLELTYGLFKPEAEIKGLKLLFNNGLSAKESIIKTDSEKFYSILVNLIKNAIKFTYEGLVEFGYEKSGEYLKFFVKDTGVGVPKYQKELIFEKFRQGCESFDRVYEGSGLGLSISKSYVEMLGGKIWVESTEGKGSIFYFTIPYTDASNEKLVKADSIDFKEADLKKLKILIVEDDEISHSLLTRMLQTISREILHAVTGVEAIEVCRNNPDLDLILMDVRMPVMDGNEATLNIRQFNKDVIIIAQTAYAFSGDKEDAIIAGSNDYISKPINVTRLHELIKKHC